MAETLLLWLAVAAAGGLGAVSRYGLDTGLQRAAARMHEQLPGFAIATINILGSFLIGVAAAVLVAEDAAWLIVGTGFLGGFTTFSTAMVDVVMLLQKRRYRAAGLLLLGGFVLCVLAAWAGLSIGSAL